MQLTEIDPRFLDAVWPKVEALVESALQAGSVQPPDMTADQLRYQLVRGESRLLIAHNEDDISGVGIVEMISYPQRRVALISVMAGRGIVNEAVRGLLEDWCRANGAVEIRGWADTARARLYEKAGFRPTCHVMRYAL